MGKLHLVFFADCKRARLPGSVDWGHGTGLGVLDSALAELQLYFLFWLIKTAVSASNVTANFPVGFRFSNPTTHPNNEQRQYKKAGSKEDYSTVRLCSRSWAHHRCRRR